MWCRTWWGALPRSAIRIGTGPLRVRQRSERAAGRFSHAPEAHHEAGAAPVERLLERHVAVVGAATARTIARPRPLEPLRSPCAAEEALEDLVAQLGRDAGPVVLDREDDLAVDALHRRLDRRARIGVAQRVLQQVEREPVQLVARALDPRRRGR